MMLGDIDRWRGKRTEQDLAEKTIKGGAESLTLRNLQGKKQWDGNK